MYKILEQDVHATSIRLSLQMHTCITFLWVGTCPSCGMTPWMSWHFGCQAQCVACTLSNINDVSLRKSSWRFLAKHKTFTFKKIRALETCIYHCELDSFPVTKRFFVNQSKLLQMPFLSNSAWSSVSLVLFFLSDSCACGQKMQIGKRLT